MSEESGWVFGACDLCGESEGEDILELPNADAPLGEAFIRRCKGCGLRRLWPRPGEEIVHIYYASDYGAYIGRRRSPFKQAIWDLIRDGASGAPGRGRTLWPLRPFFRAAANRIFDINVPLDRDPLPRILDVGCGFGDLLLYWKSRGADTLGVDFDPRAVNQAARLGLRVLLGNLADLNLPAASFDIVVFNHSLEHIASPSAMLELASRLLRPGGEIHITVPNGASAGLEIEKAAWAALCFPVHFWFFDVTTITRAIKSTGFHKVIYKTANMWRHRIVKFRFAASAEKIKIWQVCKKNLLEDNRGDLIGIVAVKR